MKLYLRITKLIIPFFLLLLQAKNLSAQWQQMPDFATGTVSFVERVNNELWAGTSLGLYKSFDEGATWQLTDLFRNKYITRIESFNDTVIVISSRSSSPASLEFCKTSFDGGITWSSDFLFPNTNSTNFREFYRRGNTLYLFGNHYSYSSTDFGITWEIFMENINLDKLVVHADDESFITKEFNGNNPLYFIESYETSDIIPIAANGIVLGEDVFKINNTIYAAKEVSPDNFELIRTTNNGQNWETLFPLNDFYDFFTRFITFNDTTYYFDNFSDQAVKIFNNGANVELGSKPAMVIELLSHDNYNDNYAELLNGSYLVPEELVFMHTFSQFNSNLAFSGNPGSGINTNRVEVLKKDNDIIWTSNFYDGTSFSNDEMGTWNQISNLYTLENMVVKGDTMICTSYDFFNYFASYDGGQTFNTYEYPELISGSLLSSPSNLSIVELNNVLYLESGNNVAKSTDWGATWVDLPSWQAEFNGVETYGMSKGYLLKVEDEIFVAAPYNSLVLKLNTSNDSWEYVYGFNYQGTNVFQPHRLTYSDSILFSISNGHFMYSENQGDDWVSPAMNGIPELNFNLTLYPTHILAKDSIWFGSFRQFGVYFSLDEGNNWSPLETPSKFDAYGGLVLIGDTLYTGSLNGGYWRTTIDLNISSGNVFHDENFNGVRDNNENGISNILVKASSNNSMVSTDENGDFQIVTNPITDTLTAIVSQDFAEVVPQTITTTGIQTNSDFAVQLAPFNDLTVGLTALGVFRPGFSTALQIGAQNMGSSDGASTVKLHLPENISIVSSSPNFTSQSGDTLIWTIPSLNFLESYPIQLIVSSSVSAPLGWTVFCYTEISPINTDSIPSNNTFTLQDVFVGSYDPNDKQCLQGNSVHIDSLNSNFELQYTIRFQNTGTYEAENVRIEDQLSSLLRWETLRIIDKSHAPMHYEINDGGLLTFYFNNIQLPDSFANEPASHGFVKYGIKTNASLNVGNVISNTAGIYFDFNEPVITNTVLTEITDDVVAIELVDGVDANEIIVIPNPAQNSIRLAFTKNDNEYSAYQIYDAFGRLVFSDALNSLDQTIQIQQLSQGMYFGVLLDKSNLINGKFKFVKQ
jgi:hypothetical protein